jgi:hypothetical protein
MERASYDQVHRFDSSPPAKAERLRKEARGTPPGVRRDDLLRRARQIETTSSGVAEISRSPAAEISSGQTPQTGAWLQGLDDRG